MDRDAIVERVRAYFGGGREDVAAVWLFGSWARGEARAGSDVDLGVLYSEVPSDPLDALGTDIAAALSVELGREVDVVVMNRADVDVIHRILRDGVLLIDRDRSARIAFEVRSRNEYFDLEPHLRRYRRTKGLAP